MELFASGAGGAPLRLTERAGGAVAVICEHASADMPDPPGTLGLAEADRFSHAVWDPGAAPVAAMLAERLDAPLILGGVSRLLHDCNRPAADPSACPARSDRVEIPGNRDLDHAARAGRAAAIHTPFHAACADMLAVRPRAALVTIHSFAPVWGGAPRAVELGLLFDGDDRLARAMLRHAPDGLEARLNAPYGPEDGVTYTLRRHAPAGTRPHVMIEIRNDLIADAQGQRRFADLLATMLRGALKDMARLQSGEVS